MYHTAKDRAHGTDERKGLVVRLDAYKPESVDPPAVDGVVINYSAFRAERIWVLAALIVSRKATEVKPPGRVPCWRGV